MTGVFVLTDVNTVILSNTGGTKNATMRTDLFHYMVVRKCGINNFI